MTPRSARRLRNVELTQIDRSRRCAWCFVDLATAETVFERLTGEKFCSADCEADDRTWREVGDEVKQRRGL
jgi:hypothetical protein